MRSSIEVISFEEYDCIYELIILDKNGEERSFEISLEELRIYYMEFSDDYLEYRTDFYELFFNNGLGDIEELAIDYVKYKYKI